MNTQLESLINNLPSCNLTTKNIRGKDRLYLQWTENGKQKTKYIRASEQELAKALVAKKRILEIGYSAGLAEEIAEYNAKKNGHSENSSKTFEASKSDYFTNVITDEQIKKLLTTVAGFKERECLKPIKKYLTGNYPGKLCIVYGLRRTGKTTLVLQAMSSLPSDKCAYIKIMESNTMAELNKDLKRLSESGVKYIFIDEITLMKDFIGSASLLSDVYSMLGIKIVLSGTDSLGFALSADNELYDRTIMVHTTFIPFREYASLLGISDIDEYIRYGGTFKVGSSKSDNYSLKNLSSFENKDSAEKYIDTAIAKNIQHSLAYYDFGGHFRHLSDLYENNELTNAINRIIEDINHRFLKSVITKDFESADLGSTSQILRKEYATKGEENILDDIDIKGVTARLMKALEIKNKSEQKVEISEDHILEIKEYLYMLDLIEDCPIETIGAAKPSEHILFSQPGMRYCQAQELVKSLLKDKSFAAISAEKKNYICQKILEEVRGRIMEEIILFETLKVLPENKQAFKLMFAVGEFDMVIYDQQKNNCCIFEIKHSKEINDQQLRHIWDPQKRKQTEFMFGPIERTYVIYRGKNAVHKDTQYLNAEEYLKNL